MGQGCLQNLLHLGLGLSHTETAHGVPVKSKADHLSDPAFSEIGKDPALDNPEEDLIRLLVDISGPFSPTQGPVQGILGLSM
jgi:hypothetical protein